MSAQTEEAIKVVCCEERWRAQVRSTADGRPDGSKRSVRLHATDSGRRDDWRRKQVSRRRFTVCQRQ